MGHAVDCLTPGDRRRGYCGAGGDHPRVLVPAADLDVEPVGRPGRRLEVELDEEKGISERVVYNTGWSICSDSWVALTDI